LVAKFAAGRRGGIGVDASLDFLARAPGEGLILEYGH